MRKITAKNHLQDLLSFIKKSKKILLNHKKSKIVNNSVKQSSDSEDSNK